MEYKREIHVNGLKFRVHPVYDQYAASKCGKVVNIDRKAILLGKLKTSGYLFCTVQYCLIQKCGKRYRSTGLFMNAIMVLYQMDL